MKLIYKHISHCATALLLTMAQAAVPAALALALTLLAPGLTSCRKVTVDPTPQDGKYEIAFDNVTTKAVITDANLTSFKVWGETTEGAADVFNGAEVTGSTPDATGKMTSWSYYTDEADAKYWEENKTYDFFAVASSANATVSYSDGVFKVPYAMYASIDGEVSAEDEVNDLIIATASVTTETITSQPNPVHLNFSHALAKVNFQIAKDLSNSAGKVVLTSVSLNYVPTRGTYQYVFENEGTWSFSTASSDYVNIKASESVELDSYDTGVLEYVDVMSDLIMIPQNPRNLQIALVYDYYVKGADDTWAIAEEAITLDKFLPTGMWEAAKTYTYKLKLSPIDNNITFNSPTVEKWGTSDPKASIIIQ